MTIKNKEHIWECKKCIKEGNSIKITCSKLSDLKDLIKVHDNKYHKNKRE